MSETAAVVEAGPLVGLGPFVVDPLIWGHAENKPWLAGVFKLVSPVCVCSSPLRIRRSANWTHRRKRQHLHSDRNAEMGGTVTERYLQRCYATLTSAVVLPRVNIYIPDSPTWPRWPFSGSLWRPPLFPGCLAARPSDPPSPSSPLAAPPGLRPRLPAPATCLLGESLRTLTRRKD